MGASVCGRSLSRSAPSNGDVKLVWEVLLCIRKALYHGVVCWCLCLYSVIELNVYELCASNSGCVCFVARALRWGSVIVRKCVKKKQKVRVCVWQ
jgi:hypothetical protein